MSSKHLMIVGAVLGICVMITEILLKPIILVSVVAFAAGALFGKGYGIWEYISRR